jgi:hypothetical protein
MELGEEITDGSVLRLIGPRQGIGPYTSGARIEDFLPSSGDKAAAIRTGMVLVSVFHRSKTTLKECLTFRRSSPADGALQLEVSAIRSVKAPERTEPLSVVGDPLPPPECDRPGAAGHCGIKGLAREPEEPRAIQRYLCSRLVEIARPADPDPT